ncbi:MAG: CCA tRNA nucleotidyltransferase, partial [Gemmatimonadaceae bacterium]
RIAFRDPVEIGDLAVNGVDLQRVGIPPGPRLGWTLRQLLAEVLQDPARNVRESLLARAVLLQQEPMT